MFTKENRANTLNGILFVALFACTATFLAEFRVFKHLGISPLIIGIILGMIYANTLRNRLPKEWQPGIIFSTKTILRTGIVFYGFRLTFQSIEAVGFSGVLVSALVVFLTFIIGYFVGTKLLKLDKDTTILTTAGSSICGAAAVLATEPVINAKPYKSAVAVSTVVLFGTIAMFLYPFLYKAGFIPFDETAMGVYIGGTIHEVAHVVAAGNAIGSDASSNAIIVKMIRVMMIAPFLIFLSIWLAKSAKEKTKDKRAKITIPWFAVMFIVMVGFNSFSFLPISVVDTINTLDTFALTMAMSALGMETSFDKFKDVGAKPVYLAFILFLWLIFGGFYIVKFAMFL
ncbi:YeiH family putative sulfate export transporter [Halarcobacter ebronensis]|uniref:YeiH family putative sulfate export transporter n=1 Tax=Halarcobacter ebronensis TaxID=1462615 RepID=A0A4Q0Y7Z9_9BACT|nr:YeiH family protein [Halarcobacter ebronensis]RXJ66340.1 YeiH family putative sulfate export transporter [Halarcobacter ebronensis]